MSAVYRRALIASPNNPTNYLTACLVSQSLSHPISQPGSQLVCHLLARLVSHFGIRAHQMAFDGRASAVLCCCGC